MAFLHSGNVREPFLRAPASVLILIGVLIAAHIGRLLLPAGQSEHLLIDYAFVPARYAADALNPGGVFARAVPFVSYMFLHADATHLGLNCLWLLAFGPVVARRFGTWAFLLFFAICGAAAAATFLLTSGTSAGAVIGASGAISGLMGAGIRLLRIPNGNATGDDGALAPILSSQVLAFSALWLAVNLAFGLTGLSVAGEVHQIAWQAHLGGYFVGMVLAEPFDRLFGRPAPELP